MNYKQSELNAFEIKREIYRFAGVVGKSKILIDEKEFNLLDSQKNKEDIVKLLLREFKRCDDNVMPGIKMLLERYSDNDFLINEMEALITDSNSSNNLKLHAIEVLSRINKNWQEEDYQQYLEFDEDKMVEDTKEFLANSKNNPSVQLDFLDFLMTVADADKYTLLEALSNEQSGDDMAYILVPVFLSNPDSPIGVFALNLLKSTKSVYAYRSLSEVFDILPQNLQPLLKKCLTELRFSGADRDNNLIHDYTKGKFSFVPPDSGGYFCLFYEKKYKEGADLKSDFFSLVCNDTKGIDECMGFIGLNEFEVSLFREKLLNNDKDIEISPEFFKFLLRDSEIKTYKNSSPTYEYCCWKQLFIDIPVENFNLEEILSEKYKLKDYLNSDLDEVFEEDFAFYWFYPDDLNDNTEEFFKFIETEFTNRDVSEISLSELIKKGKVMLIDEDESQKWHNRLLLSAYYCNLCGSDKVAEILFSVSKNKDLEEAFYEYIIFYSIIHYFMEIEENSDFSKFPNSKLSQIINYLDRTWEERWIK